MIILILSNIFTVLKSPIFLASLESRSFNLGFQIDYVDGASSGPPRLRSRGHHPPPLPPSKSTKPCIHKQHRTHPAPVAYNSDLGSTSEVTLATANHKHYSHRVTHHHHHHSSSHSHNHPMPTVYMPGGHVDMHYHVAQPQQPVKPPSSRGSHSSDTSSAYSGSDTMQVSPQKTI